MHGLRVGEVARQADVNLQTIHFYERKGLLPKPPRTAANYRVYSDDAVQRVRFVKRAQELGFALKDIKELLSLRVRPGSRCEDVRQRALAKLREIDEKIETLQRMRKALTRLIRECAGRKPITACPILEALDSEDQN
jgi:MerR family mercuric resistance operon transcriptional regulator